MAIYKAAPDLQHTLIGLPETGMGFQFVRGSYGDKYLVLEIQLVTTFDNREDLYSQLRNIREDETRDFDSYLEQVARRSKDLEATGDIRVIAGPLEPPSPDRPPAVEPEFESLVGRQDLVAYIKQGEPQLFLRYSASRVDRRTTKDGWTKCTYATTYRDSYMVPSGFAAVGRNALPKPFSARWVFPVVTDVAHYMGTTIPNYGQAGGGVEVFFPNGAKYLFGRPHEIPVG